MAICNSELAVFQGASVSNLRSLELTQASYDNGNGNTLIALHPTFATLFLLYLLTS